jgi:hypothetical protein
LRALGCSLDGISCLAGRICGLTHLLEQIGYPIECSLVERDLDGHRKNRDFLRRANADNTQLTISERGCSPSILWHALLTHNDRIVPMVASCFKATA